MTESFNHKLWIAIVLVLASLTSAAAQTSQASTIESDKKTQILFFHYLNYILPYYHASNLNTAATPFGLSGQVKQTEVKGQLSIKVPLVKNEDWSVHAAYTQKSYWQLYVKSPYFRDTTYYPEAFISYQVFEPLQLQLGVDHQSNGRGNYLERSWNRAYIQANYRCGNFTLVLKPWVEIFKSSSIEIHNPDIVHYLGRSKISAAYHWGRLWGYASITNIESGFDRGYQEVGLGFKLKEYIHLYGQFFNGYGQSLIDYNRRSTSFGLGVALNLPEFL